MLVQDFTTISLIDQEQFDMLVETGEEEAAEMIQELLDLFTEETGPRLTDLRAVAATGDREQVARHAHAIAGASSNLGGLRLSKVARHLEYEVPVVKSDEIKSLVAEVESIYEETVGKLQALINGLRG